MSTAKQALEADLQKLFPLAQALDGRNTETKPALCHPLSCLVVMRRILSKSERSKWFTVFYFAVRSNYRHPRHSIARGIWELTGAKSGGGICTAKIAVPVTPSVALHSQAGRFMAGPFTKIRSCLYYSEGFADVAQLVEQSIRNRQVIGSSRIVGSIIFNNLTLLISRVFPFCCSTTAAHGEKLAHTKNRDSLTRPSTA